jgi:hypothetical protein
LLPKLLAKLEILADNLMPKFFKTCLLFLLKLLSLAMFALLFAAEALLVEAPFAIGAGVPWTLLEQGTWTLLPRKAGKRTPFVKLSVPSFKWHCQLLLHITFIALLVWVSASDRPRMVGSNGSEGGAGAGAGAGTEGGGEDPTDILNQLVPCMRHSFNEQVMFAWGISLLLAQLELLYSRAAVDITSKGGTVDRTSTLWNSLKRLRTLDICDGFMFSSAFVLELGCYVHEQYTTSSVSQWRGASDIALALASFCTFLRLLQNAQSFKHTALMWQVRHIQSVSTAPPLECVSTVPPLECVFTVPPLECVSTVPPLECVSTAPECVSTVPECVSTVPECVSTAPECVSNSAVLIHC